MTAARCLLVPVLILIAGCATSPEPDGAAVVAVTEGDPAAGPAVVEPGDAQPRTAEVVRQDLTVTVTADGLVEAPPSQYAAPAAPFTAPVQRIYAAVGQTVRAGDVLLEVDYPSADAMYEEARAELQLAEAALQQARENVGGYVESAEEQLTSTRASLRQVRQAYHRTAALQPESPDLPLLRDNLSEAIEDRVRAEQRLEAAEDYRERALIPYQQRYASAKANFDAAQAGKKQAMVRTPIDGEVIRLQARVNQVVSPDEPVAVIAELANLRIDVPLEPEQAAQVETGMPVDIGVTGLEPELFKGEVLSLEPDVAEQIRTGEFGVIHRYVAEVAFDNEGGQIKPGMTARVVFQIGEADDALLVPTSAIQYQRPEGQADAPLTQPFVTVLRDGAGVEVNVETGLASADWTAVTGELQPGETVTIPAR